MGNLKDMEALEQYAIGNQHRAPLAEMLNNRARNRLNNGLANLCDLYIAVEDLPKWLNTHQEKVFELLDISEVTQEEVAEEVEFTASVPAQTVLRPEPRVEIIAPTKAENAENVTQMLPIYDDTFVKFKEEPWRLLKPLFDAAVRYGYDGADLKPFIRAAIREIQAEVEKRPTLKYENLHWLAQKYVRQYSGRFDEYMLDQHPKLCKSVIEGRRHGSKN